jgi:hypothetical protein
MIVAVIILVIFCGILAGAVVGLYIDRRSLVARANTAEAQRAEAVRELGGFRDRWLLAQGNVPLGESIEPPQIEDYAKQLEEKTVEDLQRDLTMEVSGSAAQSQGPGSRRQQIVMALERKKFRTGISPGTAADPLDAPGDDLTKADQAHLLGETSTAA